jgi:hypothetical protein
MLRTAVIEEPTQRELGIANVPLPCKVAGILLGIVRDVGGARSGLRASGSFSSNSTSSRRKIAIRDSSETPF